jgi:hypothetical protein
MPPGGRRQLLAGRSGVAPGRAARPAPHRSAARGAAPPPRRRARRRAGRAPSRRAAGTGRPIRSQITVRSFGSTLKLTPWSTPRSRGGPSGTASSSTCPPLRSALSITRSNSTIVTSCRRRAASPSLEQREVVLVRVVRDEALQAAHPEGPVLAQDRRRDHVPPERLGDLVGRDLAPVQRARGEVPHGASPRRLVDGEVLVGQVLERAARARSSSASSHRAVGSRSSRRTSRVALEASANRPSSSSGGEQPSRASRLRRDPVGSAHVAMLSGSAGRGRWSPGTRGCRRLGRPPAQLATRAALPDDLRVAWAASRRAWSWSQPDAELVGVLVVLLGLELGELEHEALRVGVEPEADLADPPARLDRDHAAPWRHGPSRWRARRRPGPAAARAAPRAPRPAPSRAAA